MKKDENSCVPSVASATPKGDVERQSAWTTKITCARGMCFLGKAKTESFSDKVKTIYGNQ